MRTIAWDTWAFVEDALELPRRREVRDLLREDPLVITSREIVIETGNFLVHRTGRTGIAVAWWNELARSGVRVIEHPLAELREFADEVGPGTGLSLADLSLAQAAQAVGAIEIATEDGGFHALELDPLFAR